MKKRRKKEEEESAPPVVHEHHINVNVSPTTTVEAPKQTEFGPENSADRSLQSLRDMGMNGYRRRKS